MKGLFCQLDEILRHICFCGENNREIKRRANPKPTIPSEMKFFARNF